MSSNLPFDRAAAALASHRDPLGVGRHDPLTVRQAAILRFILASVERNGRPPTVRGIGVAFGIMSPNGVMCHIRALVRKGYLGRLRVAGVWGAYRPLHDAAGRRILGFKVVVEGDDYESRL